MFSSDLQAQMQQTSLSATDIEARASLDEIGNETLIAEIERIQNEELIVEIEYLHVEEMKSELNQLKWCSLHKLQQLLKQQNFPYAIAFIDSLAQRLPDDRQVCEWQASAYLRWGRQLSKEKNLKKARSCFKKTLSILPEGSSLRSQVQQELYRLNKLF